MQLTIKFCLFFFSICSLVTGQSVVRGIIVDEQGIPTEGANVYLKGTVMGAASDDQGRFQIADAPRGEYTLTISVIGYQLREIRIQLDENELDIGTLRIEAVALQSQPIVVTASRYAQKIQDVPVSMGNVTVRQLENRNTVTIDKALQYVSGLTLTGDQISIRGSSGYSRGVGSRVMMLMDGIPYLTGATKETNFESLSINEVERIEIVKGAGSALYGSSAIGGVINVINKKIGADPLLTFRMYGGFYSDAHYQEWKWSDRTRYLGGIKFNYSNKSGPVGYRIGASHDQDDSYRQNDWMKRYHLSGTLTFDLSAFQELNLSATYMDQEQANFLYWKDLNNALEPPDDQLNDKVESKRWHLSGDYQHILDKDQYFSIKSIWFQNKFDDNIGAEENLTGNQSISNFWDAEIQYNYHIESNQLTLGLEGNISQVSSNIFSDNSGENAALYVQDEIKWAEDLLITPGLRIDYYTMDSLGGDYQINPKLGLVYKAWNASAFRLSAGRGFRAPSIAEVFTNTTASGLKVIPNHDLKPERSRSIELGYNQFLGENYFFDLAVFYNRFWDLIEGTFTGDQEIQFQNVTDARTAGIEFNFSFKALKDKLTNHLGYTFVDAKDLTKNDYLIFRPRHLLYEHARYEWNKFQFGVDYRFISAWDKIDENLSFFIADAEARVPAHILDLRIIYSFSLSDYQLETSLQLNNLFQYHYVDLVGSIAPTRNFVLTLSGKF